MKLNLNCPALGLTVIPKQQSKKRPFYKSRPMPFTDSSTEYQILILKRYWSCDFLFFVVPKIDLCMNKLDGALTCIAD